MCQSISRLTAVAAVAIALLGAPHILASQGAAPPRVTHVAGSVHRVDGGVDVTGASVGADGLLLVDAGYPRGVGRLRTVLGALGPERPRIVINTHWHHAFANESLGPSAVIIAHRAVRERLGRVSDMAGRSVGPQSPSGWPVVTFEDSVVLHFNGERITVVHLPNAHTDGDAAVVFHGSKVVMTGDAYVPHFPWIDLASGGNLRGLLRATERLLGTVPRDAKIVPGHGATMAYADLEQFRAMLLDNVEHVRRQVAAGRSLAEVQAAGVPSRWRSWEGGVPQRMFLEGIYRGLADSAAEAGRRAYEYRNGRWFDGRGFTPAVWYAVDGRLTGRRPARVDSVVDLGGRFIVPPFADAHVHDLNDSTTLAAEIERYLSRGVFYAMEQDPIFELTPSVLDRVNRRSSIDVAYTQGVVTPSWGMIAGLYRTLASRGSFGADTTLASVDTRNVFIVDDSLDLARKWPLLAARNRAFVKVIVGFSEEFEPRRARGGPESPAPNTAAPGIDPALLPDLVRRAHAGGLRVSAHIETAEDFRRAVAAGVDLIAHLPGAWQIGPRAGFADGDLRPWKLTDADARAAARRGVVVISTVARDSARPDRRYFDEIHRHNLGLLARHRVAIAIGSDYAPGGAIAEARYIASLGVLDRASVLRALVETTPRAIFPERQVGRFAEEYEASFLALEGNPLADLRNLDRIAFRAKQGAWLRP
jgi:glyoxylase-like metal-dependent hydrolase (beta-lactamase superfamily II)